METVRFEVQTLRSRNWAVQQTFSNQGEASVAFKREAMKRGNVAVRLIRVATDGTEEFQFTLEEHQPRVEHRTGDTEAVPPLALAPICETVDDLYKLPARVIINHLLRAFLEHHKITALEGLYDVRLYNKLAGTGTVLAQAIRAAARAQLSSIDRGREEPDLPNGVRVTSSKDLVDFMKVLLAENQRNGERVQRLSLPTIDPRRPDAGWEQCLGLAKGNLVAAKILFSSAVVGLMREQASYEAKAEKLVLLLGSIFEQEAELGVDVSHALLAPVDGLLADLLFQQPVREGLTSGAKLPRDQLVAFIGLASGQREAWSVARELPNSVLAEGVRSGRLKEVRDLLVHLVCKLLESPRPLVHDLADEAPAMTTIVNALMTNYHLIGSKELARALFDRQMLGGDAMQRTFRELAARQLRDRIRSPVTKLRYFRDLLAALGQDAAAPGAAEILIETLDDSASLYEDLPSIGSHEQAMTFLQEMKALLPDLVIYGGNQRHMSWKIDVMAGRQVLAQQRA